ncbi:hypothetical protein BESB_060990 [Besnoitia besnoiti]|uniref:Uncharacterized protein n=1 Tax=Besnoitia besnoiti TaxID=94643 RepID=A0A2A9MIJ7_BESBE|nr:hypothetical protein BESB_060990 [Besnoitia besnoiti]PFH35212.1 hypothetical protein BESB_060990 [Besnoitia besnoiti]
MAYPSQESERMESRVDRGLSERHEASGLAAATVHQPTNPSSVHSHLLNSLSKSNCDNGQEVQKTNAELSCGFQREGFYGDDTKRGFSLVPDQDSVDDDDTKSVYGAPNWGDTRPQESEDACCPVIWTMTAEELFGFDITSTCRPERLLQCGQERVPVEPASPDDAVRQVLRAEANAAEIVNRAERLRGILRQRVVAEVEDEAKRFTATQEVLFQAKARNLREDLDEFVAQESARVDAFVERTHRGIEKRRQRATQDIVGEVLKVDVSCPIEAVKRFGTRDQLVAFAEERSKRAMQVIHHPPGDAMERDTDIITWDDQGRARVEHRSASTKRRSVTELGSFWIRHQSRAEQHSSRPLVLLSTRSWHESDDEKPAESHFPRLRSLSECPQDNRAMLTESRGLLSPKPDPWSHDIPDEEGSSFPLLEKGRLSSGDSPRSVHSPTVYASKGRRLESGQECVHGERDWVSGHYCALEEPTTHRNSE